MLLLYFIYPLLYGLPGFQSLLQFFLFHTNGILKEQVDNISVLSF